MSTHPLLPEPLAPAGPLPIPIVSVREEAYWEYRRIVRNLRTEEAPAELELNALGSDGWEPTGVFADSPFLYLYFKRLA